MTDAELDAYMSGPPWVIDDKSDADAYDDEDGIMEGAGDVDAPAAESTESLAGDWETRAAGTSVRARASSASSLSSRTGVAGEDSVMDDDNAAMEGAVAASEEDEDPRCSTGLSGVLRTLCLA